MKLLNVLESLAPRRAAKIAAAAALVNYGWRGGAPNFFRRRGSVPAGCGGGIRRLRVLPAWFGQFTQLDIGRINGLFRKAHRWQLSGRIYTVEQLAGTADAGLFKTIASNPNHSFYQILPPFRPDCANMDILFSSP